jgi:hypothetical protein
MRPLSDRGTFWVAYALLLAIVVAVVAYWLDVHAR